MATAAEPITEQTDVLAELHVDLANSRDAAEQRERRARVVQKHAATLAGENAAARYRKLALCSSLVTDAEFRVLCLIVEKADATLANSFPSVPWLQRNLGGRRKMRWIYALIASLEAKGFLRRHRGKGWQLRLPENALADGSAAWHGPADWSKRERKHGRTT